MANVALVLLCLGGYKMGTFARNGLKVVLIQCLPRFRVREIKPDCSEGVSPC